MAGLKGVQKGPSYNYIDVFVGQVQMSHFAQTLPGVLFAAILTSDDAFSDEVSG